MATSTPQKMLEQPEISSAPSRPAWGVVPMLSGSSVEGPSLSEVMSEQLAKEIQKKEKDLVKFEIPPELLVPPEPASPTAIAAAVAEEDSCADDLLIAQMLQMQFDQESDKILKNEERAANKDSKVTISYSKYKMIPDNGVWEESEEEDEYFTVDEQKRRLDDFQEDEYELEDMPSCGYRWVGDRIVTKHDSVLSQRANGKRVMEFPPGIETGDGGAMDMKLSNQVYNKIRNFSLKENKRKSRLHDKKEQSTAEMALDPQTRVLLQKMINNDILDQINGVVSTGKESVIMHAEGGSGNSGENGDKPTEIPSECAVKVFKTTIQEFKNRNKYIQDDYRFRDRLSKWNPRKLVHLWAEKELHNLTKMEKFGIRVPEPVMLKDHVLVMSFIGKNGVAAPKLKDAIMSKAEYELAYDSVVTMMKRLYSEVHLVHADLSEYNILWHEGECVFIDVSCSVEPNHAHGLEFLLRDCQNMSDFFSKKLKHDRVMGAEELFLDITGLKLEGKSEAELMAQVRDFERNLDKLTHGLDECPSDKDYPFDYCFERAAAGESDVTPSIAVPGHSGKGRSRQHGKPAKMSFSKSPKSPGASSKSPGSSFMSMTDDQLKKLRKDMETADPVEEEVDEDGRPSKCSASKEKTIRFAEDSLPL